MTFLSPPLEQETEITDRRRVKLLVCPPTSMRHFRRASRLSPEDEEVVFQGAIDAHNSYAQVGSGLASQARSSASTPYRPYHTHDEEQPLRHGEVVELDVEIWRRHRLPAGYRSASRGREGLRVSR